MNITRELKNIVFTTDKNTTGKGRVSENSFYKNIAAKILGISIIEVRNEPRAARDALLPTVSWASITCLSHYTTQHYNLS